MAWFERVKKDPKNYLEIPQNKEIPIIVDQPVPVEDIKETPAVVESTPTIETQNTDLSTLLNSITEKAEAFSSKMVSKVDRGIPAKIATKIYEFRQQRKPIDLLFMTPSKDGKEIMISFSPAVENNAKGVPNMFTISLPKEMVDRIPNMLGDSPNLMKDLFVQSLKDTRNSQFLKNKAEGIILASSTQTIDLNNLQKYEI